MYTKLLHNLKKERGKLLKLTSIETYKDVLEEHIASVMKIFKEKQQTDKNIRRNTMTSLSPFDSRLVEYPGFTDTLLGIDCRERLKDAIKCNQNFTKKLSPYSFEKTTKPLTTYAVAVFPLDILLKWCLINPIGQSNIIYVHRPSQDPYSFYTLTSIKNGKKYWTMNCRLENLSNDIISSTRPYLIHTFRKLYYMVFKDNIYRANYNELSNFAGEDCEQLARNIIFASKPKNVCHKLREIIMASCVYKPTDNDIFSLLGDDPLQRKRFNLPEIVDIQGIVSSMFDEISVEDATNFYESRNVA